MMTEELEEHEECAICLMPLSASPLGKKRSFKKRPTTYSMRGCTHEFHKTCIKAWFAQEKAENKNCRSCPLCRAVEPSPPPKAFKKDGNAGGAVPARVRTRALQPRLQMVRLGASPAAVPHAQAPPVRQQRRGFFSWFLRRGARRRSNQAGGSERRGGARRVTSFTDLTEIGTQPLPGRSILSNDNSRQSVLLNLQHSTGTHEHYRAAVWPVSLPSQEGPSNERYQIRLLAPDEPLPDGARLATASAAAGTIGMVLLLQGPSPSSGGQEGRDVSA